MRYNLLRYDVDGHHYAAEITDVESPAYIFVTTYSPGDREIEVQDFCPQITIGDVDNSVGTSLEPPTNRIGILHLMFGDQALAHADDGLERQYFANPRDLDTLDDLETAIKYERWLRHGTYYQPNSIIFQSYGEWIETFEWLDREDVENVYFKKLKALIAAGDYYDAERIVSNLLQYAPIMEEDLSLKALGHSFRDQIGDALSPSTNP